jgi:hypothetical protein
MQRLNPIKTLGLGSALLATILVGTAVSAHGDEPSHRKIKLTEGQVEFRQDMRKLWEDHITWTRVYIIANLADAPDATAAANRLLQNQEDIGAAMAVYYGQPNGDQLTTLLKEHITTAVDVINAAKAGDDVALAAANEAWYDNAEAIAVFLHDLNPTYWPLEEMEMMMVDHLDLTTTEVVARLNSNWIADVQAYDQIHDQALEMADMLSLGIISQFPKEFKGGHASH